jgi:DNA-binding transcriptional MerR regulator
MNNGNYSISELAARVNAWCCQHRVEPLHARVGSEVTVRNIRYYQSLALVDRPSGPHGLGFSEKHRLQLIAIRLLQAKGLPLDKIQSLLYGRSEEELAEVERRGLAELEELPQVPIPPTQSDWQVHPINGDLLLLSRSRRNLSPVQRQKILEILNGIPETGIELVEQPSPVNSQEDNFRPEFD